MADTLKNTIYTLMKEGLYTEEEIQSMINDAETALKEKNDANNNILTEARAAYIEATYNYYKALGVPVEKKELEEVAKLTESLAKLKDTFTDIIKQESEEEDTNSDYSTILKFIKNI